MDGTPHLLTDVKFSERRRGYDPEEVDNFLEKVSGAVAQLQEKLRTASSRAEEADGRIAEAARAREAAEARLADLQGQLAQLQAQVDAAPVAPPAPDPASEAEHASAILLMAQRTADAAVAEATTRAAIVVRDAEAEAERVRLDARRAADDLADQKQAAALVAVRELEAQRDDLLGDVAVLRSWLDEQRDRVRTGIDALQRLVDDPAAFRPAAPPELATASGTPVAGAADGPAGAPLDDGPPTEAVEVVVVEAGEPAGEPADATLQVSAEELLAEGEGEGATDERSVIPPPPPPPPPPADTDTRAEIDAAADLDAPGGPTSASADVAEPVPPPPPPPAPPEPAAAPASPQAPAPVPAAGGGAEPRRALFEDDVVGAPDADPLGEAGADDDAAMAAFFDAEFDEPERRRFGRKR